MLFFAETAFDEEVRGLGTFAEPFSGVGCLSPDLGSPR